MLALASWTGAVFALIYGGALGYAYVDYLDKAGTWLADLLLVLLALPFTLTMRALNGGSFDFSGDMTGRVIAAFVFCCALAYVAGALIEAAIRALVRALRRPRGG